MKCKNCGLATTNPTFCSRSCAASYNNQKHPKKTKKLRFCKHCGLEIIGRRTTCDSCNPFYVDWSSLTLADIKAKALYQHSARVRQIARNIYRQSDKPKKCAVCGYDKHYEVCHVKPIKDFSHNTPISQINDIDNLVALCPNHHWEFDNGLLIF
ncbi:HNH endonuclease [Pelatocladus sp. BLCC-F211]|uniref:HNH endonuclease n=1 Tax=Pelatocladus sp. BLCC-F211 TaxID=3342752 RepID=UPI0035B70ECA